jgi:hypothetical protein
MHKYKEQSVPYGGISGSHETSCVFVRCSRTKSMQEDVRRAVPRTVFRKNNSSTRRPEKMTKSRM